VSRIGATRFTSIIARISRSLVSSSRPARTPPAPAERGFDGRHRRRQPVGRGDVRRHRIDASAVRAQLRRCRFDHVAPSSADQHVRALRGQDSRDCQSDAARTAGDQYLAACQFHVVSREGGGNATARAATAARAGGGHACIAAPAHPR